MEKRNICIIGAGSSGITAAKVLHARGLDFDVYEAGSGIGGNWRYMNDNGMSSAYRSLHINTSRDKMAYADYPMPRDYPDFPNHAQILAYFESYVDHFGFRDHIRFQTSVTHVAPRDDGAYSVTIHPRGGEAQTLIYRYVLVANGHHWKPHEVTFPGEFSGEVIHSHHYKTPQGLEDKRVVVVGVGNSGCDIACELSRIAAKTYLSTRRGAHVIPKYLMGKPLDEWDNPATAFLPLWLRRLSYRTLLFFSRGKQQNYGFPTPDLPILAEHPTVSSELLNLVGHGDITIKPNIERLDGNEVHFTDGSVEAVDAIITATGYDIAFPFLEEALIPVRENHVHLYRFVIPPDLRNLYFIGLLQPLGAVMPLAELQSEWVADLIEGKLSPPPPAAMERSIRQVARKMARRYYRSRRHTIQVDFYPYVRALRGERRKAKST